MAADGPPAATARTIRESRGRQPRPMARPIVLSREEEYRYIRSDLRRLVFTAGSLLAVMIVLLVVL